MQRRDFLRNGLVVSELIRNEEELLKRLLVVSLLQLELVQDGNMILLIQHLGLRQQLWNDFEALEQQLEPYKGIPPKRWDWQSTEERQLTVSALNRCRELMEKIRGNDLMSMMLLAKQKDKL